MAKKKKETEASPQPLGFEQALAQLEQIVAQLESGQIPLDEALARYEEGVAHLKRCYQLLQRAEQKIELLLGVDDEGQATIEPFEEESMSLSEKAQRRGSRRSTKRKKNDEDDVDSPRELF